MKRKIGLIDAYIDEWHADHISGMIARGRYGSEFEVVSASEIAPAPGKRPLDVWCRENGLRAAASPEEVVAECDAILVLAPSTPEVHEELARPALESGKPVFVDKPFCDTLAGARRMFELADRNHTPLTSFSALRYAPGLQRFCRERARRGTAAARVGARQRNDPGIPQLRNPYHRNAGDDPRHGRRSRDAGVRRRQLLRHDVGPLPRLPPGGGHPDAVGVIRGGRMPGIGS